METDADDLPKNIYQLNGLDFFNALEKHLDAVIPIHIKNILLLCDYDSVAVLHDFDQTAMNEVRDYLRYVFHENMLAEDEHAFDFLSRFTNCQDKFEFSSGQRKWLSIIANACKVLSRVDQLTRKKT